MEPFIILAIAAAVIVIFYVVWSNRSKPTRARPEDLSQPIDRENESR